MARTLAEIEADIRKRTQLNSVAREEARKASLPRGLPGMAVIEPAVALAGGLAGEVAGGLAGLGSVARGLYSGEGFEEAMRQGAESVEDVSAAVSRLAQPRTQYGAESLQNITGLLSPVGEAFEAVSRKAGDVALETTGSPGIAAAAYTAPTAVLEALGLGGLRKATKGAVLLDSSGNPTPTLNNLLQDMGLSWEGLSPAAKAAVPAVSGRTSVAGLPAVKPVSQAARLEQLRSGGSEKSLATVRVSDEGDKIVRDQPAIDAIRQWDDEGLIQAVKTASPATKAKMTQMLNLRQRIAENKRLAQTQRPTDIVGQSAIQRISYLRNVAKKAREGLSKVAKTELAGRPMNPAPVLAQFRNTLENLNVRFSRGPNGVPTPVFEGSQISANPSAQKIVKTAFKLLSEGEAPDASRFHLLKRQLDELIDYKKSTQGGLTTAGNDILKGLRRTLNEELRKVNSRYGDYNDVLSGILGVFDELDSISGKRTNIFDDKSYSALGQEFRKLFSNYGVRTDMISAIENLERLTSMYGGKFNDNIMDLSMFASALDKRFGPVAETSFAGQIAQEQARASAANAAMRASEAGVTRAMFEKLMEKYKQMTGVSDDAAYRSMEELLRRNGG